MLPTVLFACAPEGRQNSSLQPWEQSKFLPRTCTSIGVSVVTHDGKKVRAHTTNICVFPASSLMIICELFQALTVQPSRHLHENQQHQYLEVVLFWCMVVVERSKHIHHNPLRTLNDKQFTPLRGVRGGVLLCGVFVVVVLWAESSNLGNILRSKKAMIRNTTATGKQRPQSRHLECSTDCSNRTFYTTVARCLCGSGHTQVWLKLH